jgi:hypothetical protein
VKLGSTAIRSVDSLNEEIAKLPSGEPVTLTFDRGQRQITAQVRVATPLDDLVRLYLKKALPSTSQVNEVLSNKQFPVSPEAYKAGEDGKLKSLSDFVKGDEVGI